MFSVRLYIRILLQVVAIVLMAGLGVAGIVTGRAVILGFVALFISVWLISFLVYYLNASNRRIQLFLDAIEDDESMLNSRKISAAGSNAACMPLSTAFID